MQESPPSKPSADGVSSDATASLNPNDLFVNLDDANVGFKHWHPMPVTQDGNKLAGQGEMGGLWEWTSSVLEKQEGFEPMKLYPAYSGPSYLPPIFYVVLADLLTQRTSTTRSTTSCSADPGPRTRESQAERLCE